MRTVRSARTSMVATAAVLAGLAVGCAGCSSGGDRAAASGPSGASARTAPGSAAVSGSAAPSTGAPFGPGCAGLPAQGPGSVAALASTPLGAAIGTEPALSSLAAAVRNANLVDALNSATDVTLLAPADSAFGAVPGPTLGALAADTPRLTQLLTHHVLQGRLTPAQLAGEHTTLAGDRVTVAGSGEQFSVGKEQTFTGAGPATVVCGSLQTANATVYVVDQLLKPAG
jgi:uncharacterized surface protein with fasciclin (FAS1) repeats